MLKMIYTVGGVDTDITRYVDWSTVSIQEQLTVPTQLTFNAYNYDAGFPTPVQRAYVRCYSTRFNRSLFTGFISSQPNVVFQALITAGVQLFQYQMLCTSDEHLLNVKAVPFIPAFVNQTQGEVLAGIADILCPGFFDTSMVGSGDIEPYFQYDPTQSWSELAKTFADGSRYRYKVRDKQIVFQPYGDGLLGVVYDETQRDSTFDPSSAGMQTSVLAVPTVNDITIIGNVEAGNNREDYFIGDGFTGNFPLRHKVFKGSSTLLLSDPWTETDFNTQQWYVNDPGDQFNLGDGALNIVSSFALPLGQSYIQLNNGLELAGGIDLEHGEFGFNDYSVGIIGGLYTESLESGQPYSAANCLGGFFISSPNGVVTSASGAAGVVMQPMWMNEPIGDPIVSQINHTYVLQTVVTAPRYVAYNRWYRSVAGNAYGGVETSITGDITFIVQDYDIAAATGFYYTPNITKVSVAATELPAFCVYAMVNNQQLNATVNYTTLALMPLGALSAYEGPSGLWLPTGLILPLLPPGSGGYIGPVEPWPSSASGNIWNPPLLRNSTPHQEVLGNGFELQAAQITQGNEADTLAFYAQTLPAAGTPIRLQSYESQAAVARLQASGSIVEEAFIVGDDGIRSAIISNLNPLPRTSEDCDAAAQAYLDDRTHVFYNGTYNCTSYFFDGNSADDQFWPTCGRYLYVNSPQRGIDKQYMLVTQLTITVLDAVGNSQRGLTAQPSQVGEVLKFSIGFGADLHLEKVLYNFVDIQPANVLTNTDTANPVVPIYGYQVDNAYQPDLKSIMVDPILDTSAEVTVYDALVAPIEIRLSDDQWGQGATDNYVGTQTTASFTLVRQQFEQVWYMRFVDSTTGTYSRRSKVVRIYYPVTPLPPTLISADSNFLQFDFNGDIRNVYGFELRAIENAVVEIGITNGSEFGFPAGTPIYGPATSTYRREWAEPTTYNIGDVVAGNPTGVPGGGVVYISLANNNQGNYTFDLGAYWAVLPQYGTSPGTETPIVQKPVVSYGDLNIDLTQTINTSPFSVNRTLSAYFFNHQWSYSGATVVTVPAPQVSIEEGYRFAQSLNLLCTLLSDEVGISPPTPRTDIAQQIWQISADSAFSSSGVLIDQSNNYFGSLTVTVPATGDLWARSVLFDFIGSGNWSPPVHIPLGNLIASDYLAAQGSVPPFFTGASGALVSYMASNTEIEVSTVEFSLEYPNGWISTVPAENEFFNATKDTFSALTASTLYYFYLSVPSAAYTNPTVFIDGPYANPSQSALAFTVQDGRVQLNVGAWEVQTGTATGTANGGGGGTAHPQYGNSFCGVLSAMARMADGRLVALRDVKVGDALDDGWGGTERVVGREVVARRPVRWLKTGSHATCVADGHTLKVEYGWMDCASIADDFACGSRVSVETRHGMERIVSVENAGEADVCHLQLSGPRHTYVLDGFKTHNTLLKSIGM